MLTEKQLAPHDVERYNEAHEQWFARMPNVDHLIKKPFGNPRECVETFQQLGRLFAGLRLAPGMTVLDFGCGTCWMSEFLNKMGMHVVALDVSQTALDIGREMLAMDRRINPELSIRLMKYDSHRIPLEDASVDRVLCFGAFHHVPNKIEVMREIHRVMKPDSIFGLGDAGIDYDTIPQSVFERETWGVLEDNLHLEELQQIGKSVGFDEMYLTLAPEPNYWFPFRGYQSVAEQKDGMFASAREFSRHFEVFFFVKGDPLTPTSATPDRLLAELAIDHDQLTLAGGVLERPLVVRAVNTGNSTWLADTGGEKGEVKLGIHLFTASGELVNLDYFRVPLERDVRPAESATFELRNLPDPGPGEFTLEIDLVDEGFCWFKQWGTEARRARLSVSGGEQVSHAPISHAPVIASSTIVDFGELEAVDVARYNVAADAYYQTFANVEFESNKPFANYREAASISYQIGLLLAGTRIGRAQRILEFGAGAGWLASMLHRLGNELYLLDVSPTALEMARATFRRDTRNGVHAIGPHFATYDGFRFPYADEHFDRIVCFDALHHVPNPLCILKEMHRVLRRGGLAGFVESGEKHAELPAIRDCVARTGILERSTRLAEVEELAREAGFSRTVVKAFPACEAWEADYADFARARQAGRAIVDPAAVIKALDEPGQSIFVLHKGEFQFDGTYPSQPSAAIELGTPSVHVAPGQRVMVALCISNTGQTRFNATPHPLGGFATLGAHLFLDGNVVDFDFLHHPLPRDIECGASSDLIVSWTAPQELGQYELEWDVVIEGALWLGQVGSPTKRMRMIVES